MPRPSVYLNLTRAVNAPTAATNALTAAALVTTTLPAIPTLLALLSATLFYLGGLALNDVLDARDDRTNKPARPIPANQISRLHAAAVALTLLSAGLLLAAAAGPRPGLAGLLLYAAILAYNTLHRTNATTAAILMGLCRALIYPLAALIAIADTPSQPLAPIILPALAIGASTALFTAAARHEDQPKAIRNATRNRLLAAAVPAPAFALLLLIPTDPTPLTIPIAALLALWSIHAARSAIARNMRTAVLAWIASLSLIDALILSLIGRPTLAIIALAAFAATVTLQHLGSTKVSGT